LTISLEHIKKFLEAHQRRELHKPVLKNAAVLMLFFSEGKELHVLLTKRTEDVEHHKGQISFPGGSRDDEDEDHIATALRESEEEIGLPHDAVQVLGMFDDFETPTGFAITPVVAYARSMPLLKRNEVEVAEILEVPVSLFLDKRLERVEQRLRNGITLNVYFYRYGEYEIWGATASMLRAFLHSVRKSVLRLSDPFE
jgi:8-oxo-dGTP pyrophosphatase MutT (NUDIX family)